MQIKIGDLVQIAATACPLTSLINGSDKNLNCLLVQHSDDSQIVDLLLLKDVDSEPNINHKFTVTADKLLNKIGEYDKEKLNLIIRNLAKKLATTHYNTFHNKPLATIPYAGRVYDHVEIQNLIDSAFDMWLTTGRFAKQFEKELATFLKVRHCLLVNSGSSANLIAFMALTSPSLGDRQIKKGDEVITVAAGFPATITPIIQYGAIPVFLDVTLPSYNIDVTQLNSALSEKTKAVMIAHTLGNPFDIKAVKEFCQKNNLWLIEDNCDALGSEYLFNDTWQMTGSFGDVATSSFYPPHHITMGEGGAVYTNNSKIDRLAASFRDWGRDCWCESGKDNTCGKRFNWQLGELPCGYDHKYIYSHFGFNLKATDMQAAVGVAQLEKLTTFVAARRANWERLKQGLNHLSDKLILPAATADSKPSWFGFIMTLKESTKKSRAEILSYLEKNGIQTRMLFAGNYLKQPCCDQLRSLPGSYRVIGDLSVTDQIMNRAFWVGVYPGLTDKKIDFMIDKLSEALS